MSLLHHKFGAVFLGEQGGTEYPIVVYQFVVVAPAGLLFLAGCVFALAATSHQSSRRFGMTAAVAVALDLLLLFVSVSIYFR